MNRNFKVFSIMFLLIIFTLGFYGIKFYNDSKVIDMNEVKAELLVSSETILNSFLTNEVEANRTYVDKVIEIKGAVKEVNYINNRLTVILYNSNNTSQVICDMSTSEADKIKMLTPDEIVIIKGLCKGTLLDVIMHNCILVNSSEE